MPTRRVIKGVLGNFLGTYVSRYSDYNGYLLFGVFVCALDELRVNLLDQIAGDSISPVGVAIRLAVAKFEEQRQKACFPSARIREAALTLRRLPGLVTGPARGHERQGYKVSFRVVAVLDDGKIYERERVEFIAPIGPE